MTLRKIYSLAAVAALSLAGATALTADTQNIDYSSYEVIGTGEIYHDGWVDFNKNGVKDVYEDPAAALDERIADLLSQMTLEEKTCQMVTLYGYGRVLRDHLPTPEWSERLWKDGIGAIDEHLNGFSGVNGRPTQGAGAEYIWPASKHAWAINKVQQFFVEQTRLGIPVDFTNEGIRGVESYIATNFPTQLGLGHTWDRELIGKVGEITGGEGRLLGYTNVYAPILDVGRDQRWGRYEEVYGESPFLVAELGVEMVRGMQSEGKVAATSKHFLAYSNCKGAREGMARVDPQIGPHEVENIHLYPWREVIERAGLLGLMCSYNDIDGEPVEGSHYWLYERLREDMGFHGYVVSDSDAVEYLHSKHKVTPNMKESVYQSVMAGLNVRCTFRSPDSYVLPLRELVEEGRIPMSVIDERVADVLRVKFIVGLFDKPYQLDYKLADETVNSPANNEWALKASRESLVLLKNDGLLPLDASKLKRVAVIGPNADEENFVHCHYGPQATEAVTVLGGLRKALAGKAEVVYERGCEITEPDWPNTELIADTPTKAETKMAAKAVKAAKRSDVAVVVLGGSYRTCGENRSRSSLDLPLSQQRLLEKVVATGTPVVLVLINGRPLSINWAGANVNSILEAWYPGTHGGTAVAEALLGEYNPGGKLTVTFPRSVGQIPFNFPFKPNSQVDGYTKPGPDGNQSRVHGALYDFGYGLSYTTFEYSDLSLSAKEIPAGGSVDVRFKVTNTGKMAGDEVVQLYLHDCISSITVYERQLRGFERIHLEPGETREVNFSLDGKAMSLLDRDFRRVVEPGEFEVLIGASSQDIRLKDSFVVTGEGSAAADTARKFPVKLRKGDDLTLKLVPDSKVDHIDVAWGSETDCSFEVRYTNGGGLFYTLYKGSKDGVGAHTYSFESTGAAEIRILVTEGTAVIEEMGGVPEAK